MVPTIESPQPDQSPANPLTMARKPAASTSNTPGIRANVCPAKRPTPRTRKKASQRRPTPGKSSLQVASGTPKTEGADASGNSGSGDVGISFVARDIRCPSECRRVAVGGCSRPVTCPVEKRLLPRLPTSPERQRRDPVAPGLWDGLACRGNRTVTCRLPAREGRGSGPDTCRCRELSPRDLSQGR